MKQKKIYIASAIFLIVLLIIGISFAPGKEGNNKNGKPESDVSADVDTDIGSDDGMHGEQEDRVPTEFEEDNKLGTTNSSKNESQSEQNSGTQQETSKQPEEEQEVENDEQSEPAKPGPNTETGFGRIY